MAKKKGAAAKQEAAAIAADIAPAAAAEAAAFNQPGGIKNKIAAASEDERKRLAVLAKNEGNKALQKSAYDLAIKFYTKAIELDPASHILYSNRAAAYFNVRRYPEAVKDADRAIELKPDWWKAYKRRALTQVQMGNHEEAIKTYEDAIARNPTSEELKRGLQEAHAMIAHQKRHDEVMKRLECVPVFTLATPDGQPVLVSLAPQQPGLQVCTFFFNAKDAEQWLEKIASQDAEIGKTARVEMVGLDKAYELTKVFEQAQNPGESVVGCLMPDQKQVQAALEVINAAGPKAENFSGVPIFQAKHLTLIQDEQRLIPLFFAREDLEDAWLQLKKDSPSDLPEKAVVEVGALGDVLKRLGDPGASEELNQIVFVPSKEALDWGAQHEQEETKDASS